MTNEPRKPGRPKKAPRVRLVDNGEDMDLAELIECNAMADGRDEMHGLMNENGELVRRLTLLARLAKIVAGHGLGLARLPELAKWADDDLDYLKRIGG